MVSWVHVGIIRRCLGMVWREGETDDETSGKCQSVLVLDNFVGHANHIRVGTVYSYSYDTGCM